MQSATGSIPRRWIWAVFDSCSQLPIWNLNDSEHHVVVKSKIWHKNISNFWNVYKSFEIKAIFRPLSHLKCCEINTPQNLEGVSRTKGPTSRKAWNWERGINPNTILPFVSKTTKLENYFKSCFFISIKTNPESLQWFHNFVLLKHKLFSVQASNMDNSR